MKMKKKIFYYISICFLIGCASVFSQTKKVANPQNCNTQLANIIKHSDFKYSDRNYYVRIEDTTGGTVVIKAYVRNNLSDNPKKPQMVESVVSWFIIQPQHDGIYQSMNALDPEEPDFRKLKIDEKAFGTLLKCIDKSY